MNQADQDHPATSELDHRPRFAFGLPVSRWLLWRFCWMLWGVVMAPVLLRYRSVGHDKLPKDGPYLLLPNHAAMMDPFILGWPLWRPLHFMASAPVLKLKIGKLLEGLGAFPKMKFVKDRGAMRKVYELYKAGQVVTIFPEGERNWDGRNLPILPGIGRLIQKLDARVVFCRMSTNHLIHPRWARYPRWVPTHIEFDGPYTYPKDWSAQRITDHVQEKLTVKQGLPEDALTWGARMAWGLPAYLWACPACTTLESLAVDPGNGNRVACAHCGSAWVIDIETRLIGEGEAETFTVADAFDRITAHFGMPPLQDPARFQSDGVVLAAPGGRLRCLRPKDARGEVARGPITMTADDLIIGEGEQAHTVPLHTITAVSMELANRLQFRTPGHLYQLEPGDESVLKWGWFLKHWRERSRAARRETRASGP